MAAHFRALFLCSLIHLLFPRMNRLLPCWNPQRKTTAIIARTVVPDFFPRGRLWLAEPLRYGPLLLSFSRTIVYFLYATLLMHTVPLRLPIANLFYYLHLRSCFSIDVYGRSVIRSLQLAAYSSAQLFAFEWQTRSLIVRQQLFDT